jgi:hypothetical protein
MNTVVVEQEQTQTPFEYEEPLIVHRSNYPEACVFAEMISADVALVRIRGVFVEIEVERLTAR